MGIFLQNQTKKNPLVSIITVVYNGDKYLEQTIKSVINQSYQNIEYIIIDGGSTDRTLDVIQKYKEHLAYFISEPDNGLYDAMNKGISVANGQLIGMINSDDWYELDAIESIVGVYSHNPEKLIFHADRFDVLDDGSREIRKFNASELKLKYYGMTYNHPSMFIAKDEYKKHLYNTNLRVLADYQFTLEAFLRDKSIFYYFEKPIVNYRLDGVSAQMPLISWLKEGFVSRKNSGLNNFDNSISVLLRLAIRVFYPLIKRFKKSVIN